MASVLSADQDIRAELESKPWYVWLATVLPGYFPYPFAEHHKAFWQWVWDVEPGERPEASVNVWARGGAKSTSAEAACVALGARRKKRYGLYVCDTQDRADDHVGNVGAMLESELVELFYPEMAERLVGKYGNAKGWRRNRLRCSSGFTIDAIGLDTATRGVKLEYQRPDFIVIDDIDGQHDTAETTRKKIGTLTKEVIPAGAEDLAVLAIQNMVTADGVFARLVDGRADFLRRRIVSGPIPALHDFHVDPDGTINGEPSWVGQNLERCREMADDMGVSAFRTECQHEVEEVEGALWRQGQLDATRVGAEFQPDCARVVTAVDPAGTDKAGSDETGIVTAGATDAGWCPVCGQLPDGVRHAFILADRSARYSPEAWANAVVDSFDDHGGDAVVGEVNFGADLVKRNIAVVDPSIPFHEVRATRGKRIRAEPIAALSGDRDDPDTWTQPGRNRMHLCGYFPELEKQMTTWDASRGQKSPDRLDALVWALTDLLVDPPKRRRRGVRAA